MGVVGSVRAQLEAGGSGMSTIISALAGTCASSWSRRQVRPRRIEAVVPEVNGQGLRLVRHGADPLRVVCGGGSHARCERMIEPLAVLVGKILDRGVPSLLVHLQATGGIGGQWEHSRIAALRYRR